MKQVDKNPFKGRQFTAEIILWAVSWYLQFPISHHDLERMLSDRGAQVDHTTLFRWIQAYAPDVDQRIRPHLRMTNGSRRVDETYIRVKGPWVYPYRAVEASGQTIDFLLSLKRDAAAARRFFRKALKQPHTVNPRTIMVDKNAAYPNAMKATKRGGELWCFAKLRQVKLLNKIVEQDHRRTKRLVRPRLGFKSFTSALQTLKLVDRSHRKDAVYPIPDLGSRHGLRGMRVYCWIAQSLHRPGGIECPA